LLRCQEVVHEYLAIFHQRRLGDTIVFHVIGSTLANKLDALNGRFRQADGNRLKIVVSPSSCPLSPASCKKVCGTPGYMEERLNRCADKTEARVFLMYL
jgi:hypothetical protein